MTKGYMEKDVVTTAVPKKKASTAEMVGFGVGLGIAVGGLFALEALIVWVILAHLLKAKFAYLQVLGATILFEYVLGRVRLKK